MKIKIPLVCLFLLFYSFSLNTNKESIADGSCSVSGQGVSTLVGIIEGLDAYHSQCPGEDYSFSISNNSGETIAAGSSITIIVEGGIGPFTWGTNSNGYSWDSTSGVTIEQTSSGVTSNVLYCSSGSCGSDYDAVASITVTDACRISCESVVRNEAGEWQFYSNVCGASSGSHERWGAPIGSSRYKYTFSIPGSSSCSLYCDQSPQSDCWSSIVENKASYGFPYEYSGFYFSDLQCRDDPRCMFAQVGFNKAGSFYVYADIWCGVAPNCSVDPASFKLDKYIWGCP